MKLARYELLPKGIMERYLPRNLLAIVISCHKVQPLWEITWCAAAGGWWLTWGEIWTQKVRTRSENINLFEKHSLTSICESDIGKHSWECVNKVSHWTMPLPAHTASGSQSPPGDQAHRSRPGGGWRAWLSGGLWWNRRRLRRQRPGTSVPGKSRSGLPCLGAHDTPSPQTDAAASTEAHWNLPEWRIKRKVKLVKFKKHGLPIF